MGWRFDQWADHHEQSTTPSTIRGPFRKGGLQPDTTTPPFKLQVVEETLRENAGSHEIWAGDVLIETLSASRRAQRFGIIYSAFLVSFNMMGNDLLRDCRFAYVKSSFLTMMKSAYKYRFHERLCDFPRRIAHELIHLQFYDFKYPKTHCEVE
jgi:hypothetical protein